MFYLTLTFWLMVGLLEAYGIFKLWEGLVRPRWIHIVLLPGTIVSETAHFLAALLTGAPMREAKLVSDESISQPAGAPAAGDPKGIPVLSPLLMALLPILAGMTIIYLLYRNGVDGGVVRQFTRGDELADKLTWTGWFAVAGGMLDLTDKLVKALPWKDLADKWQSWLFLYLTACLSIRMVPLRGNLRGGMAAIILVGLLAAGLGALSTRVRDGLHDAWPLLGYVIALLTLLLVLALLVRGVVALIFVLADKPQPKRAN